MNKFKSKIPVVVTLLIVCTTSITFGHSGRTDSSGGHKDNKNKSGLGSYHYHCGGYPAHLHNGGCPYAGGGSTSQTAPQQSQTSVENQKKQANSKGYENGFHSGYNNQSHDTSVYTGDYSDDYNTGYDSGYDAGAKKLEEDCRVAKENGYNIGISGEGPNNTYTNEIVKSYYNEGYEKGYKEYKDIKIVEYRRKGKEDGLQDNERQDLTGIDNDFINAYNVEYDNSQQDLEDKYKLLGFEEAIKGNEYKEPQLGNEKFDNWFTLGYGEGEIKLEEEINKAYDLGYNGEDFVVSEEMTSVVKSLQDSYDNGLVERNKNIAIGATSICSVGAVGGIVYYKKKKKNKKLQ